VSVVKPFKANKNFDVSKIGRDYPRFNHTGELGFKKLGVKGNQYKTFFGPSFAHSGLVYRNSTVNLYKSHTRLTSEREVGIPGLDGKLRTAQLTCRDAGNRVFRRSIKSWISSMARRIGAACVNLPEHSVCVKESADMLHAKRLLRRSAYNKLVLSGEIGHGIYTIRVKGKNKIIEFAKPGKYSRLINDLTCPGSLYGGYIADACKTAMAGEEIIEIKGKTARSSFVKSPDIPILTRNFEHLISPQHDVEFVYFSDDSCVSIRCDDGVFFCNLDISSCDSSNGVAIFDTLLELMEHNTPFHSVMKGCIDQCRLPLVLSNPANEKEKVILKTRSPVEYSGSVLTTLLNNVANSYIFHAIFSLVCRKARSGLYIKDMKDLIIEAAASVGYIVTIVDCPSYHSLQFLKHSPVMTDEGYCAILNAGVLLRMLGQCDGDLPGRGDLKERSELFNSCLVQGVVHAGDTPLLRALQQRFPEKKVLPKKFTMPNTYSKTQGLAKGVVSGDEFAIRYGATNGEVDELVSYVLAAQVGEKIYSSLVDRIMQVDYGLSFRDVSGPPD